jgi:NAD+ diphosphatase
VINVVRPNYFSTYFIDRVSDKRQDDGWLAAKMTDETTRFLPVWRLRNLVRDGAVVEPVLLSPSDLSDLIAPAESTILLGVQGDTTYFAIDLPLDDSSPSILAALGEFQELRSIAPLLDEYHIALLAYARAMAYWHCRHRFCGDCGSPTMSKEGGALRVCTNEACGQQHFPRTDPAIIVLVTCGERCLLGRKSWWPKNMYSNVSGFVEPGESLEDALVREVWEETRVEVEELTYHSSQPWPFPSSLMLGFTAVTASETIQVDEDEFEDACWFTREEIRSRLEQGTLRLPMPVSISFRLIEEWFDAGGLGQLRDIAAQQG